MYSFILFKILFISLSICLYKNVSVTFLEKNKLKSPHQKLSNTYKNIALEFLLKCRDLTQFIHLSFIKQL